MVTFQAVHLQCPRVLFVESNLGDLLPHLPAPASLPFLAVAPSRHFVRPEVQSVQSSDLAVKHV